MCYVHIYSIYIYIHIYIYIYICIRVAAADPGECRRSAVRADVVMLEHHVRALLSFRQPTIQSNTQNINDLSAAHVESSFVSIEIMKGRLLKSL